MLSIAVHLLSKAAHPVNVPQCSIFFSHSVLSIHDFTL